MMRWWGMAVKKPFYVIVEPLVRVKVIFVGLKKLVKFFEMFVDGNSMESCFIHLFANVIQQLAQYFP